MGEDRREKPGGSDGSPGVAVPRYAAETTRSIVAEVKAILDLYRGSDAAELAEQKAMACMALAAHEIAKMPGTPHRRAIVDEAGLFLAALVDINEMAARAAPPAPPEPEPAEAERIEGPGAPNVRFFLDEKNR